MRQAFVLIFLIFYVFSYSTAQKSNDWIPLLDNDLTKWKTYLSFRHKPGYNGKVPTDSEGNPIEPIGYNKDETKVFSVINEPSGPVLRVSGEIYGCLFTKEVYDNYHLTLQVKWGTQKFDPRKDKLRDSGILYHSIGEAGVEYWRSWMLSQEFQIMEGHMGDFWCQASSAIDIRSYPSEGVMSSIASHKQPFRTYGRGSDGFCARSEDHESPAGEWTTLELITFEGKSLHIVNGHVVMVLQNSRYIDSSGTAVPMTSGRLQLQSEAAEVLYRDIRIRPLTAFPQEYEQLFE